MTSVDKLHVLTDMEIPLQICFYAEAMHTAPVLMLGSAVPV